MKCWLALGLFVLLLSSPFALADSAGTVSACKGDNAVFQFELYNQAEPLTYAISVSGIAGTLSATRLSLGRGEKAGFNFTVATTDKSAGNYPFTMVADAGVTVSRASGLLSVSNCYDSILTVSPATASIERCNSSRVTILLQNIGSKQDTFMLSYSGDIPLSFSRTALSAGAASQDSTDATITVPCSTAAGTHVLTVNSSGLSRRSASLTVQVTVPTPTPTPAGCAYSNPSCLPPKVCQDNACVLPQGCKYANPACGAGFYCDNATNACVAIPPEPVLNPSAFLSAVRACRGEVARLKFGLSNPFNGTRTYNVSVTAGLNGTLSQESLAVQANSSADVYYTVNTSGVAAGKYPLLLVARSGQALASAQAQLQVDDCFVSNLTLINAVSQNQTLPAAPSAAPAATPAAVPSAAPTAAVAANATNATKPAGVLWAIVPQGLVFEAGLQKTVAVTVRNSADYDVSSVRVLISNMTVSNATIPLIPAGKSATVDLVVSTLLYAPFNATVRAAGEQGFGETLFLVNATEGRVAARTASSAATAVKGTNGTLERVNATVRLYNYGNSTLNLSVAAQEPSVNVSDSAVSIPARSYAEISLQAQLPKGKDYNATLLASTAGGATYALPVSLRTVPPSPSTGLFSGGLVSMFSLAIVAVGVVLVLFYFARRQPGDDDEDEEDAETEDEEPAEEKKPAKKR